MHIQSYFFYKKNEVTNFLYKKSIFSYAYPKSPIFKKMCLRMCIFENMSETEFIQQSINLS